MLHKVNLVYYSKLRVSSVDKRSAGLYKCYVYNYADHFPIESLVDNTFNDSIDFERASVREIKLTYSPDPATNIAFFIMVGSSFCIAFIINLVRNSKRLK